MQELITLSTATYLIIGTFSSRYFIFTAWLCYLTKVAQVRYSTQTSHTNPVTFTYLLSSSKDPSIWDTHLPRVCNIMLWQLLNITFMCHEHNVHLLASVVVWTAAICSYWFVVIFAITRWQLSFTLGQLHLVHNYRGFQVACQNESAKCRVYLPLIRYLTPTSELWYMKNVISRS